MKPALGKIIIVLQTSKKALNVRRRNDLLEIIFALFFVPGSSSEGGIDPGEDVEQ